MNDAARSREVADRAGVAWPPAGWVVPTEGVVDAGRLEVGALFYPPPETGGTVLLLHGWADIAWSMDSIAQALVDRYRVIGLDLRGHGRSGRGPYNLLNFIGDLRGVVEALGIEAPIVIGHSLGGHIASQFGGLFPEVPRALALVEGIGPPTHRLVDEDPDAHERAWSRRHVERTRRAPTPRRMASAAEAVERVRRAHPLLDPDRAAFLTERNLVELDDGSVQWRYDLDSRDWFNGHSQAVVDQRWRGITCPVLVVNGADSYDRYWRFIAEGADDFDGPLQGADLERRLASFADVRYRELAGAGHMVPYDRPDELNAVLLEFLDEIGA